MPRILPQSLSQLADRWIVLINELDRFRPGHYPDPLCVDVLAFVREVEGVSGLDPFEQDTLATARRLAEQGDAKIALFRVHEILDGRIM
nr:hypothetical protein [Caballeronia sp. GACF5]